MSRVITPDSRARDHCAIRLRPETGADVAVRVENLGKRYRLGERQRYRALRDTLTQALKSTLRAATTVLRRAHRETHEPESFWALRNVSFEIRRGEVVGIIGRNGAGKSTLLKILSRVTEPTEGHAEINGRVGSLLEVGTGFHPELTGRENIFLNGAILGMSQREVHRKFDEIVDFAEVEAFLDTPVKRFSSGMYMRLAFAVAAHLEPEILLVDEVLAVGDAAFQRKCLGKMHQVAQAGRTVFLVSHNLSAVVRFCSRALLFDRGRLHLDADPLACVASYQSRINEDTSFTSRRPTLPCSIFRAALVDDAGRRLSAVTAGDDVLVEIEVVNTGPRRPLGIGISVETHELLRVVADFSRTHGEALWCETGHNVYRVRLRRPPLNRGTYFVTLAVHDWKTAETLDRHDQCFRFQVHLNWTSPPTGPRIATGGVVLCDCEWTRRGDA